MASTHSDGPAADLSFTASNSSREQANMDSAILAISEMRAALAQQAVSLSDDAERLSAALDAVVPPPQRVRERETQTV